MSDSACPRRQCGRLDETCSSRRALVPGRRRMLVDRIVELVTADGPDLPVPMRSCGDHVHREGRGRAARPACAAKLEDRSQPSARRDRARPLQRGPRRARRCGDLHAPRFAQRILTAFPVEAGLPPRIEVHDEVSSLLAFEERWRTTRDDLLDDPALEPRC